MENKIVEAISETLFSGFPQSVEKWADLPQEIYDNIKPYVNAEAQDFAGWIANQSIQGRTYHKLWIDYCSEKEIDPNNVAIDESSLKRTITNRGFGYYEFFDKGKTVCTLQKSSSVIDAIWLGAKEIGLQHFKAGEGWSKIELVSTVEEHYVANNRMELTQEQVKVLLPILIKFVQTGEI